MSMIALQFFPIIKDVFIILMLAFGLFFYFVGVVGLIRMPDVYCRIHATTKCDTLGAGFIFLGLMIWQGFTFVTLNLAIVLVFIWLTNPTAAHFIAKSEYINQQKKKSEDPSNGTS